MALPGGDFPMDGAAKLVEELIAHYPFLQRGWAERLIASYGRRAWLVLGGAQGLQDCGVHFGHGLTACEVDYLIAQEWARKADDILWRRSKLGLHLSAVQVASLESYLGTKMGAS